VLADDEAMATRYAAVEPERQVPSNVVTL